MKYTLCMVAILMLSGSACKRDDFENNAVIADDPGFSPSTNIHKVSTTEPNDIPCLFENNFLKVVSDSLPFSSNAWYIIKNGDRLLMSVISKQLITAEGDYELDYTFNRGNQIIDTTIQFSVSFCSVGVVLSDAFSPNGDGEFDKWSPIVNGAGRYSCVVKNDKGMKLYTSSDPAEEWDGTFDGKKVPSGTYEYVVEGTFKNGKLFEYKGTFELIR